MRTCDSDDGLFGVGVVTVCGDGVEPVRNELDDVDESACPSSS